MTAGFFDDTEDAERSIHTLPILSNADRAKTSEPLPADILEKLLDIADFVSVGRGYVYSGVEPYPDAKARAALGSFGDWKLQTALKDIEGEEA